MSDEASESRATKIFEEAQQLREEMLEFRKQYEDRIYEFCELTAEAWIGLKAPHHNKQWLLPVSVQHHVEIHDKAIRILCRRAAGNQFWLQVWVRDIGDKVPSFNLNYAMTHAESLDVAGTQFLYFFHPSREKVEAWINS